MNKFKSENIIFSLTKIYYTPCFSLGPIHDIHRKRKNSDSVV